MSVVTDTFLLVGELDDSAEERAERLLVNVMEFIHADREWPPPDDVAVNPSRIISLNHPSWESFQYGSKVAGGAAIWIGWNHASPRELAAYLTEKGWKQITLWWQAEEVRPQVELIGWEDE